MAGIVVRNPRNMRVGLHVLVVDDDPLVLLIAKKMLTTQQYHVTTAFGGREALSLLKDTKGKFDLVLCDIYMPGIDGFHLLRIARAVYNIPFVFMSSDHKLDVMERGLKAGARFFFPKPLTMINYENLWQFVYIENVEYFEGINIEDQGPPPPPSHDRLSLSDDIRRQGRNSSSSSNNSNEKKRRQDDHHDNKRKKRPYKKHEKEDHDFGKKIAVVPLKKRRVTWTSELHEKFLHALSILRLAHKRAVPKRILSLMKVKEVNRANIASHLQKYRLYQNKYKGTLGSDRPRRRIRMRLPIETKYHDYSPSHDHSMWFNYSPSRPQSPLLGNQPGLQGNLSSPNNFNQVPSTSPQYHFKEGSKDSFIAKASYGNPAAVTNPGYLERQWMSGARTMNQTNVDTYPSLFGTSALLYGNDVNNDSDNNAIPIMVGQQINQGMQGFLPNVSLDPNFDNLSFESLKNSPPSTDIENMGALSALNGTIDDDISNTNNSVDNNIMDEIRKGKKPIGEAADDFSLVYDLLDFDGMNNLTSLSEPFVVNSNYVAVGESSTSALVNPNNLQQGNEVNNSGWFSSIDDIANFFLNQGSEN